MNRNTKNVQNKRPNDGFFRRPKHNRVTPTPNKRKRDEPETKGDASDGFFVTTIESPSKTDVKKPFDKRAWRLQKYSKKYKLDQWEGKRKKVALREYYKQMKDEPKVSVEHLYRDDDGDEINDNENNLNANTNNERITLDKESTSFNEVNSENVSSRKKRGAFIKARMEYDEIKEQKRLKKEEMLKKKEERLAAIKEAKRKKIEKYKKLNQRTKKSQPIMKYRMEMLLEEIQEKLQKEK